MRVTLRVATVLGATAYVALLLVLSRVGSLADGAAASAGRPTRDLAMVFPLLYFAICFWSTFAKRRSRILLAMGGAANLLLGVLAIALSFAGPTGWLCILPAALYILMWTRMYFSLREHDN